MTTYQTTEINPHCIVAPHRITDGAKHDALRESFLRHGWTGRPLLVIEAQDTYLGLTGSHRTEAACSAELEEVPCVVIDSDTLDAAGYSTSDLIDDDLIALILAEVFGASADCARLMREEVASNMAQG